MFNKTIFIQTLKQNWKLWMILTTLMALMVSAMIATFDPVMIQAAMDFFGDQAGAGGPGRGGGNLTLVGMIGDGFFSMWGLVIPLIYVIVTAISLIVSKVDRGSMAYTMSTPIKRLKVVGTQAIYLIASTFTMFLVVSIVGLGVVQLSHGALTAEENTPDIIAAAEVLNISPDYLASRLLLIVESEEALATGAQARGIYEDVYTLYLGMRFMNYLQDGLYEIIGMTIAELQGDPEVITENQEVIDFIAGVFGFSQEEIDELLTYGMGSDEEYAYAEYEYEEEPATTQEMLMVGISAAADYLNMSMTELMAQIGLVRQNPNALAVAVYESGGTEQEVINFINQMWAMNELALDDGMQFSVADFLNLNFGAFLLMFAIGSITFLASCIFNLSKNALIIGAGLPVGFLILEMLSQISEDFEMLRYLSLNTLFDPSAITGGDAFIPQFIVLAILGAILYLVGIKVFKEKDLPL